MCYLRQSQQRWCNGNKGLAHTLGKAISWVILLAKPSHESDQMTPKHPSWHFLKTDPKSITLFRIDVWLDRSNNIFSESTLSGCLNTMQLPARDLLWCSEMALQHAVKVLQQRLSFRRFIRLWLPPLQHTSTVDNTFNCATKSTLSASWNFVVHSFQDGDQRKSILSIRSEINHPASLCPVCLLQMLQVWAEWHFERQKEAVQQAKSMSWLLCILAMVSIQCTHRFIKMEWQMRNGSTYYIQFESHPCGYFRSCYYSSLSHETSGTSAVFMPH